MRTSKEIKAELDKVVAAGHRMNALQNESRFGEGFDHMDNGKVSSLCKELDDAIFAEEFTLEKTIAKRALWNSGKRYGINPDDLRKAVKFHNL